MRNKYIPIILLSCLILASAFLLSYTSSSASAQIPIKQAGTTANRLDASEQIAYVASSRDRQSIHLVKPDGSGDHLLYQVPAGTHSLDAINFVAWRSDGTELAFDSGHDWQRSLLIRDLYSIAPDGTALRRITRPPAPEQASSNPAGTVRFLLDSLASGDVQLYIEGAVEPLFFAAKVGVTYQVTYTVHDLGANARQWMRLWDPDSLRPACNYAETAWVDVIPGQLSDVGPFYFGIADDYYCPKVTAPAWLYHSDDLLYLYAEADNIHQDENNLWRINNHAPVTTVGDRLLDYGQYVSEGRLFLVTPSRSQNRAGQFLAAAYHALGSDVFIAPLADASQRQFFNLRSVCSGYICPIVGLAWLPDGSGFLFSQVEKFTNGGVASEIFRYRFADGQISQIFKIENQVIGRLDVSPDGQSVVFERGNGSGLEESLNYYWLNYLLSCPCQLWTVNMDGSDAQMLVADGRAPAWSPLALSNQGVATPTPVQTPTPISTQVNAPIPSGTAFYLPLVRN